MSYKLSMRESALKRELRKLRLLGQSELADAVQLLIDDERQFRRNSDLATMNAKLGQRDDSLKQRIVSLIEQADALGVSLNTLKATLRELKHEG